MLILDSYVLSKQWENSVKPFVQKLIVIDDQPNRTHNCDLLIDQNLSSNNKKYYCGDGTFECLGVWTLNQIINTFYQSYQYKEAFEAINIILARTDEELINTGHGIQSKTNALFLSGMIHMKWDNYDQSINYFNKNLVNNLINFIIMFLWLS